MERKKQMDLDDEERLQKFIEKQIERANEEYPTDEPVYTELQKDDDVKGVLHHFYDLLHHVTGCTHIQLHSVCPKARNLRAAVASW